MRRATDFIDGKRVIGGYLVSLPLAIVALVLYALLSAVAWYRKFMPAIVKYNIIELIAVYNAPLLRMGNDKKAEVHAHTHYWILQYVYLSSSSPVTLSDDCLPMYSHGSKQAHLSLIRIWRSMLSEPSLQLGYAIRAGLHYKYDSVGT